MKNKKTKDGAPAYPIESVNSVLTIIALFKEGPLRLSAVAEKLGVAVSTAHRLLAMLKYHGMAEQDPATKAYHPGPELFHIGLLVVRNFNLREIAKPFLARLARELGETVHLSIPEGTDILVVDSVESGHALRVSTIVGMRRPAHLRAAGLACLSRLDDAELEALYPTRTIPAGSNYEKKLRSELFKELDDVHKLGYAIRKDHQLDIVAIAAPIVDSSGQVKGAVGLSLPMSRYDDKNLSGIVSKLQDACQGISDLIP